MKERSEDWPRSPRRPGTQSQSPLVPPTPLVMPGSQLLPKHGGSTPPPPPPEDPLFSSKPLWATLLSLLWTFFSFLMGLCFQSQKQSLAAPPRNCRLVGGNGKQSQLPTGRTGREKKLHAKGLSEDSIFGMCFLGPVQLFAVWDQVEYVSIAQHTPPQFLPLQTFPPLLLSSFSPLPLTLDVRVHSANIH